MAQLKDLLVAGDSRFVGKIYGNLTGNADTATKWAAPVALTVNLGSTTNLSLQGGENTSASPLNIGVTGILPVAQGGLGVGTLTSGQALIGNGTGAVQTRAITNNTAATTAPTGTNLITANTLYYALPKLNNSKSYTSSSTFYAPTTGGTADYVLIAAGATSAPVWTSQSSLSVGMAAQLATARYIDGVAFNGSADITHYGVCSTAAATAAKTVTVGTDFKLVTGARITVKFTNNNTVASPTLNVNSTGAKPLYRYGTTAMATDDDVSGWMAGAVMSLVYDGTGWIREFWDNDNTTYTITSVWCGTAAGTAAKVSSNAKYYVLREGNIFEITFRYANSAASALTLNINGTGAKPIYLNGAASSSSNYNLPAGKYIAYYDGTNYYINTDGTIPWNPTYKKMTLAGNDVYLGGSLSADTIRTSLGLSNAMHFIGVATVAITDGSTTDPKISGYTTKQAGDVVIDKDSNYEYVWSSAGKWEKLGGDSSFKTTQTAVSKIGDTLPIVLTSISQNANGVITATSGQIANLTLNGKTYNGSTATNVGTITVPYGGTGVTTLTQYGLLLGNGTGAIQALAPAAAGCTLIAKGTGANPAWDDTLLVDDGSGISVTGYVQLDNAARFKYNSTDKCIDVIFN